MKKVCLYVLFLATLTLGAVNSTLAWDEVGHKITAYIAWQQMTPAVARCRDQDIDCRA